MLLSCHLKSKVVKILKVKRKISALTLIENFDGEGLLNVTQIGIS